MASFDPRQVAAWTGGAWRNGIPPAINGVSIDSRRIEPGNIFIAIPGPNFDGHDFVGAALKQGACAALVARFDPAAPAAGPLLLVPDTAKALQQFAAHYRQTFPVKIIAVTGSVGKTTVKEMIAAVLARRFPVAKTLGNWNNAYGLPLSILNMAPQSRAGVFELGVSQPGEMAPLCQLLQPDYGVVTAVGPVHLEFFGSEKAVAAEKSVLLRSLPPAGIAFLGRDDRWYEALRAAAGGRVVALGRSAAADYILCEEQNPDGLAQILERESGASFSFRPTLPGRHIVYNSLFAIALARTFGMDWAVIRAALASFRSQPMRWEAFDVAGVQVINDAYNANPMSMAAALQTFADLQCRGRKILVLAGMHELGEFSASAHRELGATLAKGLWAGLITVGRLGRLIAEAACSAGLDEKAVFTCDDHAAAAGALAGLVRPGDAVLFKASRCERLEEVLRIWRQTLRPPAD